MSRCGQPVEIAFKYLPVAHLSWQGRDGSATVSGGQTGFGSGDDALMTSTVCEIVLLTWLL